MSDRCAQRYCNQRPAKSVLTGSGVYPQLKVDVCQHHADQFQQLGWMVQLTAAEARLLIWERDRG